METPTSIKKDFMFRMNEMLANLLINEDENKRIREQFKVVKANYEKEELALTRMGIAYKEAGFLNKRAYSAPNKYFREYEDLKMRVEELDHTEECLKLIARMKEDFGEQSVLVPTEDFNEILSKYNLVCGRLDEYCGTVPFDKLANIARIKRCIRGSYWRNNIRIASSSLDVHLFIAAPKECFQFQVEELDPFVCCLTKYGVMVLEAWDIEAQDKTLAYYREQESLFSLATTFKTTENHKIIKPLDSIMNSLKASNDRQEKGEGSFLDYLITALICGVLILIIYLEIDLLV